MTKPTHAKLTHWLGGIFCTKFNLSCGKYAPMRAD